MQFDLGIPLDNPPEYAIGEFEDHLDLLLLVLALAVERLQPILVGNEEDGLDEEFYDEEFFEAALPIGDRQCFRQLGLGYVSVEHKLKERPKDGYDRIEVDGGEAFLHDYGGELEHLHEVYERFLTTQPEQEVVLGVCPYPPDLEGVV
jgi:hypothetical protein